MALAVKKHKQRNNLKGIARRDIEKAPTEPKPRKHHQADYEQETIIVFNKAEREATIYTHEKTWQQHLEKKLHLVVDDDNKCGGKTYRIDKSRIKMPHAPKKSSMTAEQKKAAAARLRTARLASQNKQQIGFDDLNNRLGGKGYADNLLSKRT